MRSGLYFYDLMCKSIQRKRPRIAQLKSMNKPRAAIGGFAIVFACFTGITPCAQADEYFCTGSSGSARYLDGGKWLTGTNPPYSFFSVPVSGSAVQNGFVTGWFIHGTES